MGVDCRRCPLRKRRLFDEMTEEELRFMLGFKTGELSIAAGATVLLQGTSSPQLFTVLSGLGLRYHTLENGRRQVINILFPGDFVGLQASVMGELGHSVEAVTPMVLCAFQRNDLWRLFRHHPDRAYDLTWIAAADRQFLGETLASLGQRSALERVAWALLRIYQRLEAVGLGDKGFAPLPLRQQDLADALGLSLVHTNKTLAKIRSRQLARWQDGELYISDIEALAEIALVELEPLPVRPLI